jgi:hypothetical protein
MLHPNPGRRSEALQRSGRDCAEGNWDWALTITSIKWRYSIKTFICAEKNIYMYYLLFYVMWCHILLCYVWLYYTIILTLSYYTQCIIVILLGTVVLIHTQNIPKWSGAEPLPVVGPFQVPQLEVPTIIYIYIYNILLYIYKAYASAKFKGICPHFCGFIWYSTSVYLGMLILYFSVVTGQRRISKGGVDRFC